MVKVDTKAIVTAMIKLLSSRNGPLAHFPKSAIRHHAFAIETSNKAMPGAIPSPSPVLATSIRVQYPIIFGNQRVAGFSSRFAVCNSHFSAALLLLFSGWGRPGQRRQNRSSYRFLPLFVSSFPRRRANRGEVLRIMTDQVPDYIRNYPRMNIEHFSHFFLGFLSSLAYSTDFIGGCRINWIFILPYFWRDVVRIVECLVPANLADRSLSYSVPPGNLSLRDVAVRIQLPYVIGILRQQLLKVLGSRFDHIPGVLGLCPRPQVFGIDTRRITAKMANHLSAWDSAAY